MSDLVGRTPEETADARNDWGQGTRFGSVADAAERIPAPPLSLRAQRSATSTGD